MSQVADLLEDPSLSVPLQLKEQNITVVVSGSRFCVVPSLYKKVEKLSWYEKRGIPQLNANPDAFEILLQFFLFGSLPEVLNLADHEAKELKELAEPLNGAKPLIEHVEAGIATISDRRESSSFLKRKLATFTPGKSRKKQHKEVNLVPIQETVYPFAASKANATIDVDYLPNLEASDSTDSEESSLRLSASIADDCTLTSDSVTAKAHVENTSKKCRRFLGSVLSGKTAKATRKLTHEEWCASDYVL
jgi:hypothetical protein